MTFVMFTILSILMLQEGAGQTSSTLPQEALSWSDADQIAWVRKSLAEGMPTSDTVAVLARSKSAIMLPVLEKEVEELLRSPEPHRRFKDPLIDPDRVVYLCVSVIAHTANEQSLAQESKLIAIDPKRFGNLVGETLDHAYNRDTGFQLAYQGLALRDPEISKRIIDWAEERLTQEKESILTGQLRSWASALLERYHGIPSIVELSNDPIAIRLKPTLYAALEQKILKAAADVAQGRPQ